MSEDPKIRPKGGWITDRLYKLQMRAVDDSAVFNDAQAEIHHLCEEKIEQQHEINRLTAELANHRKFMELITDNGSDYPETMDEMIDLGLVVEAPPSQDFIDEWGDDCEMYVLAWSPLASRALDGEKVSDE